MQDKKLIAYCSVSLNNNEIKELYNNIVALQVGKKIPSISLIERNGNIKEIGSIKNSKNDLVLSKNSELELINYRNSFNLFFKETIDFPLVFIVFHL